MQVEIIPYYSKDASPEFPFWVKSKINNEIVVTNGESWDEAISRHRQKLSDILTAPKPPLPFFIDI